MTLQCPGCEAPFKADRDKLAAGECRFSCGRCGHRWAVKMTDGALVVRPLKADDVLCPNCGHTFSPQRAFRDARTTRRILVAEDHDFFLKLVQDALGREFETISVRTTGAAIREIERQAPDLLILDLVLAEGGNGLDVLRQLSERRFPVLVYTSRNEEQLYGEAWNELRTLGVDDVIVKGLNVGDELRRKVESLLRNPS